MVILLVIHVFVTLHSILKCVGVLCKQEKFNPHDERFTVEELREMIGDQSIAFSNRVLHFATTLRGTRAYWFKQRMNLIAMIDFLGLPTLFFTHSAADLQWPELATLMCPDDPESVHARREAIAINPAIADWFFYECIVYESILH